MKRGRRKSHSHLIHITSTSHPHHIHISSTSHPHLIHISSTSHPHLIHITSTSHPHPHLIHISSTSHPHLIHITSTSHPHLINITSTSPLSSPSQSGQKVQSLENTADMRGGDQRSGRRARGQWEKGCEDEMTMMMWMRGRGGDVEEM